MPFAVYIPTSFPDRLGELWWLALEAVVARNKRISLLVDGKEQGFDCATVAEKRHLFDQLYGWVRSLTTEDELRNVVRDLSARYQVDIAAFCEELCMSWDELAGSRPTRWSPSAPTRSITSCWPRCRSARRAPRWR